MAPNSYRQCCSCCCSSPSRVLADRVLTRGRESTASDDNMLDLYTRAKLEHNPDALLMLNDINNAIDDFQKWYPQQCLAIKAAITTATSAFCGAIIGVCWDAVFKGVCSSRLHPEFLARLGGYQPLMKSIVRGPRWEQARSFAVMCGVNSGISFVMKELRGKDDVQTSMVAAFGSGVMVSLVSGMRGPEVISVGLLFAVVSGGRFKVQEKLLGTKTKDVVHDKKKDMFSNIGHGVDQYAKNLFTKNALSMFNGRKETKKEERKTWFNSVCSNFIRH